MVLKISERKRRNLRGGTKKSVKPKMGVREVLCEPGEVFYERTRSANYRKGKRNKKKRRCQDWHGKK